MRTPKTIQYPIDDFKSGESWRLFKIMGEFVEGIDGLHDLGPAVSIFGSARTAKGHPNYETARKTAACFAAAGYAIITGGGPGIMEAANLGATEQNGESVGLRIALPFEEKGNNYMTRSMDFNYFFIRKVMFVKYAQAYIIMPGGLGTMDEMFETLTLVQTQRIRKMPVILMNKKFWAGLLDWIKNTLAGHGLISPEDIDLFSLADTPEQALKIVDSFYNKN
nr:TIGR00730 family Rossman fold protein [uncultured Desulfobacter sp.]